jgi:serine/threonine protein kinase
VREEPDYEDERWAEFSPEVIDLVQKLLMKDREERITIEQVLEHSWITKGNAALLSQRRKSTDFIEKFKAMSLTKPHEEGEEPEDN